MDVVDGRRPPLRGSRFVGAADSKEQLVRRAPCPYITVRGTKGGSSIVASCVNALMYNLVKRDNMLYVQGKK